MRARIRSIAGLLGQSRVGLLLLGNMANAHAAAGEPAAVVAVGPQYDTTHVYVAPADVDRFAASFVATLGGHSTKQVVATVTPTPSSTSSQLLLTPVGTVSLFGFKTAVPYPFGTERTGYLVTNMDQAIRGARMSGAAVLVAPFPDPIGRDAIIQWPGGINMQIYWHNIAPSYQVLQMIPENRIYVSSDSVSAFERGFLTFSHGSVVSDDSRAPGIEIGRPGDIYRRLRIKSTFGNLTVLVTDGHLPYPYGREITGYGVPSLADTLGKANSATVTVLVPPYTADGRDAAMVQFPGGYIAELHDNVTR